MEYKCTKCGESYPYDPAGGCNVCGSSRFIRIPDIYEAQNSADKCCGENAPKLDSLESGNVISIRNKFLGNVQYNGKQSHLHIINVLNYMYKYI